MQMGVQIPDGEGYLVYRWTIAGDTEPQVITLGIRDTAPPLEPGDAQGIANTLTTLASSGSNMFSTTAMADVMTFRGVTCYIRDGEGFAVGVGTASVVGLQSSSVLPTNCAILCRKDTGVGGRKYRGRWYLPVALSSEANVDQNGFIVSGSVSTVQGYVDALVGNLAGSNLEPVLHHSDGSPGTLITSFTVQDQIATQRKRMR